LKKSNVELAERKSEFETALKENHRELRMQKRLNERHSRQIAEMKSALSKSPADFEASQTQFSPTHPFSQYIEELIQRSHEHK
jgi:hypothetical protein